MRLAFCIHTAYAVSLNAFTPNVYWPEQRLPLVVNKVQSAQDDHSFAYYDLPFVCQPIDGPSKAALSLGEIIRGDRTLNSDYDIRMLNSEPCKSLCTRQLDRQDIHHAYDLIRKDYKAEFYIDELVGATAITTHDKREKYYIPGFRLGELSSDKRNAFLYNHYNFVIKWRHSDNHDETRVVLAFEVYPRSVASNERQINPYSKTCALPDLDEPSAPLAVNLFDHSELATSLNVTYTYSVFFREDLSLHWISRWNPYFSYSAARTVWYTTLVSAGVCLLLSAIVATILLRTLSKEITDASLPIKSELEYDLDESAGWKLIRAEVFRPPYRGNWLSAIIGSGVQLIVSAFVLATLSATGLAHNRGRLSSVGVFLFAFTGEFSGYFSSKIYRTFDGERWLRNALCTALGLPAFAVITIAIVDIFAWLSGSSVVMPFDMVVELLGIWGGISLPLVIVGSYVGHRSGKLRFPGRVATIPRQIPRQPFYTRFWPSLLLAGALPYAAICTESYFIFKSFELHQDGYLFFIFGSLSLVFLISSVITIEVTVVMIYLQLQHENYKWWWRAFLCGASTAGYIFAHATLYFLFKLRYGFVSGIIYFGYTMLFCVAYGLFQGTLSFLVSVAFTRRIYGAIKAD